MLIIEAADLFLDAPKILDKPKMRPPERIAGTSPEIERMKAKQGGCCGKPSEA